MFCFLQLSEIELEVRTGKMDGQTTDGRTDGRTECNT